MNRYMNMWVYDQDGRSILFAEVDSVDEARGLWVRFAGLSAGQYLSEFSVKHSDGEEVYRGSYVTDEC